MGTPVESREMVARSNASIQGELFQLHSGRAGFFDTFGRVLGIENSSGWVDRFAGVLRGWVESNASIRPKTISLFSGAGGLDIAFHDCGFEVHEMVEIDERFVATLSKNAGAGKYLGPNAKPTCLDIRQFVPSPDSTVDFIIGGPPCQTFSAGGRRAGGVLGTTEERGTLFEEYVRILKLLKPKGFLFENVYGITGAQNGEAWESIKAAFRAAGYLIYWRILDAADYGVPQHRERMFIVGLQRGEFLFPRPTHGPDSPDHSAFYAASSAIAGCALTEREREAGLGGRYGHLLAEVPPGLNYSFFTEEMGHPNPVFSWRSKFSDFLYKADPATPIRTLKAQGGQYTGPFHWENRPFSVAELKRLQTFPDTYEIIGGRQASVHQIGNSVPPQLGRVLALSILDQVFGVDLPAKLETIGHSEQLGFRTRKRSLTARYRSKAEQALENGVAAGPAVCEYDRSYKGRLEDDFNWMEDSCAGNVQVNCAIRPDLWHFTVDSGESSTSGFKITAKPVAKDAWALKAGAVELVGLQLSRMTYTAAWKAFECEIQRQGVKADLVQLSNYYQYAPRFRVSFEFVGGAEWQWSALKRLLPSELIAKTVRAEEISSVCAISLDKVLPFAVWLRDLGHEVRNQKTNPQIPEGCFLVPYSFPTFSPMSVQLRKTLHDDEEQVD